MRRLLESDGSAGLTYLLKSIKMYTLEDVHLLDVNYTVNLKKCYGGKMGGDSEEGTHDESCR